MRRYRAIIVALAAAAAAAFGACGDDGDGGGTSARCQDLTNTESNTGCTVVAHDCDDGREYTVDCLVNPTGYDCKCRIDNTIDSEFTSEDYCDDTSVAKLNESCGWSIGG